MDLFRLVLSPIGHPSPLAPRSSKGLRARISFDSPSPWRTCRPNVQVGDLTNTRAVGSAFPAPTRAQKSNLRCNRQRINMSFFLSGMRVSPFFFELASQDGSTRSQGAIVTCLDCRRWSRDARDAAVSSEAGSILLAADQSNVDGRSTDGCQASLSEVFCHPQVRLRHAHSIQTATRSPFSPSRSKLSQGSAIDSSSREDSKHSEFAELFVVCCARSAPFRTGVDLWRCGVHDIVPQSLPKPGQITNRGSGPLNGVSTLHHNTVFPPFKLMDLAL
jgi:hypothetical protein